MTVSKTQKNELIRRAKENSKPEKANYTFRLNKELMEAFKAECAKSKVTPTAILEGFLKDFTVK